MEGTQLGVLKAGYEVGVHAMRALGRQAEQNEWVILLLDFANAFNSVDRNLMLKLAAAYCPELVYLTSWLYRLEPNLVTSRGDTVKSSTGTQQGCSLSNPLFALVMEYISKKLESTTDKVRAKLFFWDDAGIIGSPTAVASAWQIIEELQDLTGLRLKKKKCHLHGTNKSVNLCLSSAKLKFSEEVNIHHDFNMLYLQVPIGSDKFVEESLD